MICPRPRAAAANDGAIPQDDGLADFAHVRQAMAVSLFKDRLIWVAGAAKLANEPLGTMLTRLARLGVPVADCDAPTLAAETAHGAAWLQAGARRTTRAGSSLPMPAR